VPAKVHPKRFILAEQKAGELPDNSRAGERVGVAIAKLAAVAPRSLCRDIVAAFEKTDSPTFARECIGAGNTNYAASDYNR
jgi:hypothetical protein